jgi:hypothetical protein
MPVLEPLTTYTPQFAISNPFYVVLTKKTPVTGIFKFYLINKKKRLFEPPQITNCNLNDTGF